MKSDLIMPAVAWEGESPYTLSSEALQSFALNYSKPADSTRFLRLKCVTTDFAGLPQGTLLDDQCNRRAAPYYHARDARPLLVYKSGMTNHAAEDVTDAERQDFTQYALWLETPQMMVCSFSLCNFLRARFAPQTCWRQVVQGVVNWLAGTALPLPEMQPCYRLQPRPTLRDCARAGIEWFEKADMLLEGGYAGVREGLATEIYPDGRQETAKPVRTDCAGEAAMAYFFHALATDDADGLEKSRLLEDFVYNVMQIHDGAYRGMLRWTDAAWGVCYQDDAARAMLVTLFRALYGKGREHLADCRSALEFLMNTTGPDGLRPARTDLLNMTPEDFRKLSTENADFPCAHYNAFYLGCLLLYGKLTGDERCLTVGERGMRSIWRTYPHTVREQSETEELCRLLLPTAWLYYATGKAEDKALLYTLVHDLEKMRHPSGGQRLFRRLQPSGRGRVLPAEPQRRPRGRSAVQQQLGAAGSDAGLFRDGGRGILPPVLPPCRLFAALPDTQRRPEAGRRVGARL